MRYAVTGTQMKKIDQDTIQRIGIPSVVLMERAALAAVSYTHLDVYKRQGNCFEFTVGMEEALLDTARVLLSFHGEIRPEQ